ncbi:hypothetical protein ACWD6R_22065 [Streptomyces sp. NPDC005151]
MRTEVVGLDGAFSQTFTVDAVDTVAIGVEEDLVDPRVEAAAFALDFTAPGTRTRRRHGPARS